MKIVKIVAGVGLVIAFALAFVSVNEGAKRTVYVWYMGWPNAFFETMLDENPIEIDGQKIHPKVQYHLQMTRDPGGKPFEYYLDNPNAMAHMRGLVDLYWPLRAKKTKAMAAVEDRNIKTRGGSDIRIRIYTPESVKKSSEPAPVMVYYHGGAFLIASIEAVDPFVRLMANRLGVIVVSVNYRLAPEHRYPAAHDDAIYAYRWVLKNAASFGANPNRVLVGGDSAGGNLALSVSHRQIESDGKRPIMQLLYYPSTDLAMDYTSYGLFKNGFGLDEDLINAALSAYVPDESRAAAGLASPVNYDTLDRMPPTVIATAGFDPIRDQGAVLAKKLNSHNVKVRYFHYPSLIHNFLEYTGIIDDAETAAEETTALAENWLKDL